MPQQATDNWRKGAWRTSVKVGDSKIASALHKMHDSTGVPYATYVTHAIAERLERMDVHSMTLDEIEEIERNDDNVADTV